jgi:polyisoprenoid-binding protein YceI
MVKILLSVIAIVLSAVFSQSASAQPWNLPADLNSSTMKVTFEIGTTWHTVEGVVKTLSGRVWLESPRSPNKIRASLVIPVASLDTDSESRDEELRDSMEEKVFHSIRIEVPAITPSCDERNVTPDSACTYTGEGTITIRDVTLPLTLTGPLRKQADGAYTIAGDTVVDWSAFGVKDPSILVARVYEKVKVAFHITLPKRN